MSGHKNAGLCECGCGQRAPIAPKTNAARGVVKGLPQRFVHGHGNRRPLAERFWSKVDKRGPDECWEWRGSRDRAGYGRIGDEEGARSRLASRIVWELHHGEKPNGYVLHRCDNPPCVNPAHLFVGTHADNMRDMQSKGRHWGTKKTHCPRGHPFTPENTCRNSKRPERRCRICTNARLRDLKRRQRAAKRSAAA